jgi:hypothetical protein
MQWVSGALSLGVKRGRGVMLTTHPLLVPRLRKSRSYTSSHPNAPLWSVTEPLYLYLLRMWQYYTSDYLENATTMISSCAIIHHFIATRICLRNQVHSMSCSQKYTAVANGVGGEHHCYFTHIIVPFVTFAGKS